jgi:acetyl-CoA synthase
MTTIVRSGVLDDNFSPSSRTIEGRGINVPILDSISLAFSTAFEGERVHDEDLYLEFGGEGAEMVEWITIKRMNEVEDGRVDIFGPEITEIPPGSKMPLAIVVEVAGRDMRENYEPVLERQIHYFINYIQGVTHLGQRNQSHLKVSKEAFENGFRISHIGMFLHACFHQNFGHIFERLQVKIYTDESRVKEINDLVQGVFLLRDTRINCMTDENTETFYSCTICQSISPSHVCIISPERAGQCGYNWLDCDISYQIKPLGPNQPVPKGEAIDCKLGQWKGINDYVFEKSGGRTACCNLYSLLDNPMPISGICECIAAVLPMCNGIMMVNFEYSGKTPSGMTFRNILEVLSWGVSTPGFTGHGKYNTTQRKFLTGDGGLLRIVWMPKSLKIGIGRQLQARADELGIPDLPHKIADESIGISEEAILPFLQEKGHPALTMPTLLN